MSDESLQKIMKRLFNTRSTLIALNSTQRKYSEGEGSKRAGGEGGEEGSTPPVGLARKILSIPAF